MIYRERERRIDNIVCTYRRKMSNVWLVIEVEINIRDWRRKEKGRRKEERVGM